MSGLSTSLGNINSKKMCMMKVKGKSKLNTYTPDAEKANTDAVNFDTMITGSVKEAIKINPTLLSKINDMEGRQTTNFLDGLYTIFCNKKFNAISTSNLFETDSNLEPLYPDAICIFQNCLANLGVPDRAITYMTTQFYKLKNILKDGNGILPLYDLNIPSGNNQVPDSPYFNLTCDQSIEDIAGAFGWKNPNPDQKSAYCAGKK
jgi:hypothetical protein